MGYPTSAVRWRDDTGWELRCPDCRANGHGATFWPLTEEFWDKRNTARCLACHRERRRKWERQNYLKRGPDQRRRDYAKAYRADAKDVLRKAAKIYYYSNRERELVKAKRYYDTHRDEVLARKRAAYAERRAA